jgi:hypothetical protein
MGVLPENHVLCARRERPRRRTKEAGDQFPPSDNAWHVTPTASLNDRNARTEGFRSGYNPVMLWGETTSESAFRIVSPSQTAARVDTFMIAVFPQTGQRHRNANGETAAASQSQGACFMDGALLVAPFCALDW